MPRVLAGLAGRCTETGCTCAGCAWRRGAGRSRKITLRAFERCEVPVIERVLGCRLDQAHIDLRYVLAALGFKGGLKRCEVQLGMDRGDLEDIDGLFAVVLWKAYLRNRDERALETLLAYNLQDAINLEALMLTAFNMSIERCGFHHEALLPMAASPENPLQPHRPTISKYRREVTFLRSLQPQW